MELEKWRKLIEQWQGLITGISLLVAAIIGFSIKLFELNPFSWSWRDLAFLLLAILLVAGLMVRSRRANASRLVDPDALKLDPQSPEQLVGRREDLDKLLKALVNPLVFLVSESGCGKSALLRAGVAQGPAFTQRFLPIYIDMSVLDWEDGPLRAVREGFAQALPNDDPARSKLDTPLCPASVCGGLRRLLSADPAPAPAAARPVRRLSGGAASPRALSAAGYPRLAGCRL